MGKLRQHSMDSFCDLVRRFPADNRLIARHRSLLGLLRVFQCRPLKLLRFVVTRHKRMMSGTGRILHGRKEQLREVTALDDQLREGMSANFGKLFQFLIFLLLKTAQAIATKTSSEKLHNTSSSVRQAVPVFGHPVADLFEPTRHLTRWFLAMIQLRFMMKIEETFSLFFLKFAETI